MDEDFGLRQKLASVLPYLNERQRCLVLTAEAGGLGRGGITRVARASDDFRCVRRIVCGRENLEGAPCLVRG